jgi:hypothetical protein
MLTRRNMRNLIRAGLTAAGSLAFLAGLLVPAATSGAVTIACANHPRCFGVLSGQAHPLEIATAVPALQVKAGTQLTGMTPVNSPRADWRVGIWGRDRKFRWMPDGHLSNLCITAVSDLRNSRPALEPCVDGTAGSSHQLWRPVNVIDHGFRVYRNEANGLVLALASDTSGTPLRIRQQFTATSGAKNFTLIKPF